MCLAAVHTGTGYVFPLTMTSGRAIQPRFIAPNPSHPSLDQARDRSNMITQGLLIENVVLFWEANVPTLPPSLIPICILGSQPLASFPGPYLLQQQGWARPRCPSAWHPMQPTAHWIPLLGRPPRPWLATADSAPNQWQEGASQPRAGLPKPSSDSAAAATVSSLHWPQILEDSSRGLQGAGGSRSACSSCSSTWLRRYMSM